jgi:predicted DNA-binding protein with PD1-like motif
MEYTTGSIGRVFAARFHDGEGVYTGIEEIARLEKIESAMVFALGGARRGRVVVGPKETTGPIEPMTRQFDDARELVGVGTIHPDGGEPSLHFHAAVGRCDEAIVGCPREGLDAFLVLEVVIIELTGLSAERRLDPDSGLRLLAFAGARHVDVP